MKVEVEANEIRRQTIDWEGIEKSLQMDKKQEAWDEK